MISEVEADKIDQWLRNVLKEHSNPTVVDDDFILYLAYALCDDIPLGYEASHRLANWLFCHLNTPKISGKLLENVQDAANRQKDAEERLNEAFSNYERCTKELMARFKVLNEMK